ncbi:ArsC family protein [Rhodovulum sp. P5]|uniref:ArsC/Spx/MgsR family protein n=1 Tax=Rhodovulum sp. P5 TaxID=1564506 RepID=UPI0009C1C266|nr:ArsC/Spx/MgsR family protein [Rhodovulum sp. P5]ARE39961.1 ArsC family protein [Rhodovulum sp. P5]
MILYGLKTCDTCRKARAALEKAGHEVRFHDVRDMPLGAEDLTRLLDAFGDALINRRSTTWRQLDEGERARPPLDLLGDHPTLMKRPAIDTGETLYLGWGKEIQAALIG